MINIRKIFKSVKDNFEDTKKETVIEVLKEELEKAAGCKYFSQREVNMILRREKTKRTRNRKH